MLASYTMVNVATAALANNPDCQKVVLMQAVPRYDNKEDLNNYGNEMMNKALAESTSDKKDKVVIGVHNLDCQGGLRLSRYGDATRYQGDREKVDMVHMRGASGKVAYTRSVAAILAKANLASTADAERVARSEKKGSGEEEFSSQGRRGRGGPQGGPRGGPQGGHRGGPRGPRRGHQQQVSNFHLATRNRFGGLQQENC